MKQKYFFQEVDCYYCLVTNLCPTLCNPLDFSTPGFPVLHCLPEFTRTHVHLVGDAIQPSHPQLPLLLLPSVFLSIRVFSTELTLHIRWPEYLSMQLPVNIQGWFPVGLNGLLSLKSKGLSRVFSSTTFQKHQLFGTQPSLWSNSHDYWKSHSFDFVGKVTSLLFSSV